MKFYFKLPVTYRFRLSSLLLSPVVRTKHTREQHSHLESVENSIRIQPMFEMFSFCRSMLDHTHTLTNRWQLFGCLLFGGLTETGFGADFLW